MDESTTQSNARAIWDSATATMNEWAVFRIPKSFRGSSINRANYRNAITDSINTITNADAPDEPIRFTTKIDADSETLWVRATIEEHDK